MSERKPIGLTTPYRKIEKDKDGWVGLTEEDFVCIHQLCKTPIEAAEYTEHLLKEKNT